MGTNTVSIVNVLVPVVAVAVTALATWVVTRRGAGTTFTAELLRENTYIRERNKDLEDRLHNLEQEVKGLEAEVRRLLSENLEMYRRFTEQTSRYPRRKDQDDA